MARIKFMNTEIDNLTMKEALNRIDELIVENHCSYVVTPNVDHIVQLEKGGPLVDAYKNADLILADGKPLIWISKWYKTPIKEKISGSDLFPRLCELAANKGYKMFFLGAAEGVAQKAAGNLTKKYHKLRIVGTYSPPFGFETDESEIKRIISVIKKAKPDILIVGLGCPKQELFIHKYKDELSVPISLGLGASLDFEAGVNRRSPKWISDCGFEWLFRLFHDPRRLAKRYLLEDIYIFRLAMKYKHDSRKNNGCI